MAEKENVSVAKNQVFAQIVKGFTKDRKPKLTMLISVKALDKYVVPFKELYLSQFESFTLEQNVGVTGDKFNNKNIIVELKKGISKEKQNVYYLFDISVRVDNEIVPFKKMLVSEYEAVSLRKSCGFDLTNIESIQLEELPNYEYNGQ